MRIVSNDDGWLHEDPDDATGTVPISAARIGEMMVAKYAGSPVETVTWCVGNSEVYQYETAVGERTGAAHAAAGLTAEQLQAAVGPRGQPAAGDLAARRA
jgi:hypothetical protein